MMNRVRDGSKFFYNVHTKEYAWARREDIVKDFSLLTRDEVQVSVLNLLSDNDFVLHEQYLYFIVMVLYK